MNPAAILRGRNNPNYGRGQHSIDPNALLQADPREMARRMVNTFKSGAWQPPRLPEVASQIMNIASKPDTQFSDMVGLLSEDSMLAAQVLKVAQSPIYAGRTTPKTLDAAVGRLGMNGLRNVVIEASMGLRIFRADIYKECLASVQRHSRAVAHLSHMVARRAGVDHDEAFLAGLMHDVGLAGGILLIGDVLGRRRPPPLDRYWYAIEAAHTEGGAALARLWELPEHIGQVVAAHHQSPDRGDPLLPATILVANKLAILGGFGVEAPRSQLDLPSDAQEDSPAKVLSRAAAALRIDRAAFNQLRDESEVLLQLID